MAYKKTEPKVNFAELEHQVLDFWRSDDTFHKSLNKTKMGEPFNFYDGPPFANGLPHFGHLNFICILPYSFQSPVAKAAADKNGVILH